MIADLPNDTQLTSEGAAMAAHHEVEPDRDALCSRCVLDVSQGKCVDTSLHVIIVIAPSPSKTVEPQPEALETRAQILADLDGRRLRWRPRRPHLHHDGLVRQNACIRPVA
jgi:hypothetical protein